MPFVVLIVIAVVVWLIVSPFIVFSLWHRLNELEDSVTRLRMQGDRRQEATTERIALPAITAAPIIPAHPPNKFEPVTVVLAESVQETHRKSEEHPVGDLLESRSDSMTNPVEEPSRQVDSTSSLIALSQSEREEQNRVVQSESSTLEEILAGKWLTWVGALAVIIGAGFGFKYAVENGWLDPSRRVILGLIVGICSFVGGAIAMRRDYRFLGQGLTGAAMGVLYMSCYAANQWYNLVPYSVAFVGMALTTGIGLAFAARFNSQPTAFLGLLGGFLTPAMLQGMDDPFWILFPYLLLLDAGVLWVSGRRRWLGVQNLAFISTCLAWLIWIGIFRHFDALALHRDGPFWPTLGFLTAFFIEFAAMGVIFNIAQQRPAQAGDFFLILATPVAYFGAIYGLTYLVFPYWQGLFAAGMTVIYGYLTVLCAQLNPRGKSVAAAMAGMAGTFLIIAAPLQFTGHWVTMAWIAESVLLIEIGLRFREKTLAITGLSLLAKVQFILLIYALGTFVDPVGFQTAFVRKQFHLIGGTSALTTSWTSLFNGRSFSYLVDVLGLGWLAWSCRRRVKSGEADDLFGLRGRDLELWLASGVPLVGLTLAITETFVWGMLRHWHGLTLLSGFTMWAALVGVALIAWSVFIGPRPLEKLGWFLFVLMGGALLLNLGWSSISLLERGIDGVNWSMHWWLFNPRGLSFLAVFIAGVGTALIYKKAAASRMEEAATSPIGLDRLFGSASYLLALTMVLLETFAWGKTHDWTSISILCSFSGWTSLFGAGLAIWRFFRKSVGLDGLHVSTFVLLGGWLAMSSVLTLHQASGSSASTIVGSFADGSLGWWLLNPRGASFLLAIAAAALSAWLERCRRLSESSESDHLGEAITRGEQFGLMACFTGLAIVLLETTAWGLPHNWVKGTLPSCLALGTAPFALGLAVWATHFRRRAISGAVAVTFVLLGVSLCVSGLDSLDRSAALAAVSSGRASITFWLFHPRGAAFLTGIAVAGVSAALYLRSASTSAMRQQQDGGSSHAFQQDLDSLTLSQALGVSAWIAGLVMFTLEAIAQGFVRGWETETGLAVTLSWTAYALGTLIAGIYWRSGTVRVLALSVFMLTVAKVFLVDVWHLDTAIRVFAFVSLGVTLLLVSFLYRRYRDRIREWIAPAA